MAEKISAREVYERSLNLEDVYARAPEDWCLAEFMARLAHNGEAARRFLKKRGYINETQLLTERPQTSTLLSVASTRYIRN